MSAQWNSANLLEPISPDQPCGQSLEDTDALSQFDAYQIFGQTSLDPPPKEEGAPSRKEPRKSDRPPNWMEIQTLATDLLTRSKDLRLLAHLGAAVLRTEGVPAFFQTLSVASGWLGSYWAQVYPLVEEDALFRRNALNCCADRAAIVEGLRRAPLVSSRQHGRFSLRDLEVVAGTVPPDGEAALSDAQATAAFAEMAIEDLRALRRGALDAASALGTIDETMRSQADIEAAPSFDPLLALLKQIDAALQARLAAHPAAQAADAEGAAGEHGAGGVMAVGAIRSRQDAIRALDAAAEFFRRNEPSSPVPMLVDRAKRLVAKDFLEVLADVAPEALPSARAAGGIRE